MPIVQLDTPNPLGQAIGTAAGYLAANPARKAAKEQQQYERKRQSDADQRAAQELANNTLETTDKHTTFENDQAAAAREAAARATQDQTIGKAPAYDPAKPAAYLSYATKAANYYAAQGLADSPTGKFWTSEAQKLPGEYQQYTGGQKNVSGSKLDDARTKQINNWRTIENTKFQNRMKELAAQQNGKEQIANANRAQAFALAQMREGGAMARAQMSDNERMTIAEMTALNAASGQDMTRAFQTAKTQYDAQMKGWEQTQKQGAAAVAAGDDAPAGYGAPAPQFNFTLPQQGASSPTIVVVPMPQPDGTTKMVPQVVHPGPKPPKKNPAAAKPAVAKPSASAPPSPGGGGDLGSMLHGLVSHFFGGGGGGSAAPAPSNGKVVKRADAIAIGAKNGLSPDAAIKDAQAHGYKVVP